MQLTCRFLRVRFWIKHHCAYKLLILKYFYHLLSNTPFSFKVYYTGFFLLYTFVGLLSVHTLASIENLITWSKVSRSLATTALIPGDFTFYSSFYSLSLNSSLQCLLILFQSVFQAYVWNLDLAIVWKCFFFKILNSEVQFSYFIYNDLSPINTLKNFLFLLTPYHIAPHPKNLRVYIITITLN